VHGERTFLKRDEKLKLILEVNRLFRRKIPYNRRNYSKRTMIRTMIREEPIKLAQYLRETKAEYIPTMKIFGSYSLF
jgi:hypothetical protein